MIQNNEPGQNPALVFVMSGGINENRGRDIQKKDTEEGLA